MPRAASIPAGRARPGLQPTSRQAVRKACLCVWWWGGVCTGCPTHPTHQLHVPDGRFTPKPHHLPGWRRPQIAGCPAGPPAPPAPQTAPATSRSCRPCRPRNSPHGTCSRCRRAAWGGGPLQQRVCQHSAWPSLQRLMSQASPALPPAATPTFPLRKLSCRTLDGRAGYGPAVWVCHRLLRSLGVYCSQGSDGLCAAVSQKHPSEGHIGQAQKVRGGKERRAVAPSAGLGAGGRAVAPSK